MSEDFIIKEPAIELREKRYCVGIRGRHHFNGMFKPIDQSLKELRRWVRSKGIDERGPYFLRLHLVNMSGEMEFEVGIVTAKEFPGDDRVKMGVLPKGKYATMRFMRYSLRGNKYLIDWARNKGLEWDVASGPNGDLFACRYEAFLTDYRVEPRKKHWDTELAIKLAD